MANKEPKRIAAGPSKVDSAISMGSTGASLGGAIGGPPGAAIGFGLGAVTGLVTGGKTKKNHAAIRAGKQAKQNRKVWEHNWEESLRATKYAEEGLKIQKKNDDANIRYAEETANQDHTHKLSIRDYEFSQANRAFNQSKETAKQQIGFNRQAAQFAKEQQKRAYAEQLTSLLFDEKSTLLEYNIATAGLASKKREVSLQGRKMTASAQNATQRSYIESLEAAGDAQASGSGRSNAKAMQAAIAKAGANEAAIADELMFGLQGIDIATDNIGMKGAAMRAQLSLDKLMLEETRNNVDARNVMVKRKIKMDKIQANAVARAKIHLKPEISPAMPKPLALPRPEYQDIYQPKKPPKPKKHATYIPQQSGFSQAMSSLAAATPDIIKAFQGGSGYQPNMRQGSFSSLADVNFTDYTNNFEGVDLGFGQDFGSLDFGLGDMSFNDYNVDFNDQSYLNFDQ